ncbi:hypothetical protein NDU88_001262 [Pleurodeles waltl]|uniref:Uncharacterized protein n=1 Tax=Pleurodeles waltl TaxID=8319 RepID=A0AAV7WKC6_PLEWA|nr:hypothetical protein NDU88_001262 [Pleurodeles waltl]
MIASRPPPFRLLRPLPPFPGLGAAQSRLRGRPDSSGPPHWDLDRRGRPIGPRRSSRDPRPHSRPRLSAARKAASPPRRRRADPGSAHVPDNGR